MSIVAGCSLLDGVLLAADCRVTIQRRGSPDVLVDNAQKLFPVAPGTAIGFVGDVRAASQLLCALFAKIAHRRQDPVSLSMWMPRLFRHAYARLNVKNSSSIAFMVASALHDRPNIVEREVVGKLLWRIGSRESPVKRNWAPGWLAQILDTPPEFKYVAIPGTSRGALYVMRSPNFNIESCETLQFVAVGSGKIARTYIERVHDMIFAGSKDTEVFWLREAIRLCIQREKIQSVGGLYPVLKVTGRQIECYGESAQIPVGGTSIELKMEANQWTQRNLTTGKEIRLLPPWEIQADETQDHTFDDFEEIIRQHRRQ